MTSINTLFESLFSSIDSSIYDLLDDIIFINTGIFDNSFIEKLLGPNASTNLLIIANSLLIGFFVYYCFRLLFSNLYTIQVEPPYQFIFKVLVFSICINFSFFICEKLVYINSLISSSIRAVGENLLHKNICFSQLIDELNSLIITEESTFDFFSFDGIIKSFTSINLLTLSFSFALRYIMVKVFILITPFAILTLLNNSTSWFFKSWFRSFFSLLIIQSFISLILLIIFTLDFTSDTLSKILFVGALFALTKVNMYVRDLIGGISTDIQANFSNFTKK
ncbi:MAG: hypothetical protein Q4G05_05595 [Clostridia bacterium]|nr:hypothetical protein [Clostridia bacterium]